MELIKIIEKDGQQLVSARDLHKFFESSERFSKWFDRAVEYSFCEGEDYTPYQKVHPQNNQLITDYAMTIDMAKEISMLQRSEKGKQARLYFIECEKKLKEVAQKFYIPKTLSEALMLAAKQTEKLEAAEKVIEENKPKVEFYDTVTESPDVFDMRTVATVLNMGVGRNKIFAILRMRGVLDNNNKPYQQYIDRGYFRCVESVKTDGHYLSVNVKTVVYQKGLDFIRKILKEELR